MKLSTFLPLSILLLALSPMATATQWEFFHPELVVNFGCSVKPTDIHFVGSNLNASYYEAQAFAHRKNGSEEDDWSFDLAQYPLTTKGRDKAIDACKHWTTEAERRIKKAKGIK